MSQNTRQPKQVAKWSELADRNPTYALVADVDLVVVRLDDEVSVLYGRCLHRGALMPDGTVKSNNLVCGVHGWDYRVDTGVSEYNNVSGTPAVDVTPSRIASGGHCGAVGRG